MTTQRPSIIATAGPDKSGLSFGASYALSATAACVAETSTYPFDMIKTRLQAQGEKAGGQASAKRNMFTQGIAIVQQVPSKQRALRGSV